MLPSIASSRGAIRTMFGEAALVGDVEGAVMGGAVVAHEAGGPCTKTTFSFWRQTSWTIWS